MDSNKLLIIGGIPYSNKSETIGGTTVLLQNFIDYCNENNISHKVISTNKYSGRLSFLRNYFYMIYHIFLNIRHCKSLMVNISSIKGSYLIFPSILFLAKIYNRKIIFRKFAGNFKKYLSGHSIIRKFIITLLKSTNLSLFETKEIVDYFKSFGINAIWFPNARKRETMPKSFDERFSYNKRFIFMAHVKKEKGIDEIIDCFKKLPDEYSVDIYGQIIGYNESDLNGRNFHYKGVAQPKDVFNILKKYDVLLLPTHWVGEGYPGIIIEGFSIGLPCIATKWGGIPEIVHDNTNGILIEPYSAEDLAIAIKEFDNLDYSFFSTQAIASFEKNFESNSVNKRVLDSIYNL